MRRSRKIAVVAVALLTAGLAVAAAGSAAYGQETCPTAGDGDLNGDGHADVVIGRPFETVEGRYEAGAVTVHFGGGKGSTTITQSTPGIPGTVEPGDGFGRRVAMYDVDGDRCDDLVVAAPYEGVGSQTDAGAVWVIPGSPSGLAPAGSSSFSQDTDGVAGTAEAYDYFGGALAAYGDGDDAVLVIGTPAEDDSARDTGSVYVRRGQGRLTVLHQDTDGVPGHQELNDQFGSAVAVSGGVFAVGVAGENVGTVADAGMVHVFQVADGTPHLTAVTQNTSGISGMAEYADAFGASIDVQATSHLGEISYELAIGSPGESLTSDEGYHGSAYRISLLEPRYNPDGRISQRYVAHQDMPGVAGVAEAYDRFGASVDLSAIPPSCDDCSTSVGMAVTSGNERSDAELGDAPAIQVFGTSSDPGQSDFWIKAGEYGLPADASLTVGYVRGYASRLFLGDADGERVYGLPWRNIVAGGNEPVTTYP